MFIVTGGAGFIGCNLIRGLNAKGIEDILVVDNLTDGTKIKNLTGLKFSEYLSKEDFIHQVEKQVTFSDKIEVIFHQGACTVTTETDGKYMLQNNYEYSKILLQYALRNRIPFIYASSAATYGINRECIEKRDYEEPLNVYGFSKFLFDQYVRKILPSAQSQVMGLRYFNVYGPYEAHKQSMSSVIYRFNQQLLETGKIKLFQGSDIYADGEQKRDYIHVRDVVALNLWLWQNPDKHGIVNVGTGKAQTFNEVARMIIQWHNKGEIEYIPFPEELKGVYQHFTQANLRQLRTILKCELEFAPLEEGIDDYLAWLNQAQ